VFSEPVWGTAGSLLAEKESGQVGERRGVFPSFAALFGRDCGTRDYAGDSVVPLDGEWKFQPGDSQWLNGAPEWAQSDFDDSKWVAMDLTTKGGAVDLTLGTSGYVPGWIRVFFEGIRDDEHARGVVKGT
jgi:hypothetical protein